MRLLHRASSWRHLFAEEALPAPESLPALLAPLAEALTRLGESPSLAQAKAWQPTLVDALWRLDLPAWRIAQLISDHDVRLYRRAIDMALDDLQATGWGEPPVRFCVLVMGSVARHESLLGPDQDNGMIVEDYPDARHVEFDGYFQALGERFTARLDDAGLPLCHGHVMACWPMWRKRLGEWCEQLDIWSAERHTKRVQQLNILSDFTPVYGEETLAETLRHYLVGQLGRASLCLNEMAQLLDEVPVALDRLGRLCGDGKDAPHDRAVNLKRQGIMPLVSATRLLSLVHGIKRTDTRHRLNDLVAAAVLDADDAQDVIAALDRLQSILLVSQMANLKASRQADGWVDMATLDSATALMLRHDLQTIRHLVRLARSSIEKHRMW
ncbi:DUF294 nucleotidyltransferase-like domain-containing protein [Aidingimonas lacisalsi]|uniref:DUF294 nucleotidyltransferase-like domain-containing protein n=1 Tax=Aidingimonas lacisalsi TaxID=2604086 RepID=UPI0011D2A02B|nr:DUF294 nucleotidyltransferase-like domain-containing protein [Aidingimonas lacisalsi]